MNVCGYMCFLLLMIGLKFVDMTERVEALGVLENAIKSQDSGGQYSSALIVYLYEMFSKFSVSNINLVKSVIQVVLIAAQHVGDVKFSKPAAWMLLKEFGDKLSDKKVGWCEYRCIHTYTHIYILICNILTIQQ